MTRLQALHRGNMGRAEAAEAAELERMQADLQAQQRADEVCLSQTRGCHASQMLGHGRARRDPWCSAIRMSLTFPNHSLQAALDEMQRQQDEVATRLQA